MEEEKKVVQKISLKKHVFSGTAKTKYTTSNDFAKAISSIFTQISSDFQGTRIFMNRGFLQTELYFAVTDHAEGEFKFVDTVQNQKKKNDLITRINSMNRRHAIVLTEGAKEILKDFIPPYDEVTHMPYINSKKEPIWKNICNERAVQTQNYFPGGVMSTMLSVAFDMTKFLKGIYGTTNEKGNALEYTVTALRALNPMQYGNIVASSNYLLAITQYNRSEVIELTKKTNSMPQENYLNIIK